MRPPFLPEGVVAAQVQAAELVATGTVATGASVEVTVTWRVPFPSDAYVVVASVHEESPAATGTLRVRRLRDRLAGSVKVVVENTDLLSRSGFVHAIALRVG